MPDEDEDRAARIARMFSEAIPHARALGMVLTRVEAGEVTLSMPYDRRFIGDPQTGVIHGGAVSALIDTCAGAAVITHPDQPLNVATLDLRIDYMRAAEPGLAIQARATCYHMTRSVAFVRVLAWDREASAPIATAHGAFTVDPGVDPAREVAS